MLQQNIDLKNQLINSYNDQNLVIDGDEIPFPCVIFEANARTDLLPSKFEDFNRDHLALLIELGPEIILLGTGSKQKFLETPVTHSKVAIEIMNTGSACRVFNVLVSESRSVLAALY